MAIIELIDEYYHFYRVVNKILMNWLKILGSMVFISIENWIDKSSSDSS